MAISKHQRHPGGAKLIGELFDQASGMSYRELADKVGCSRSHVEFVANLQREPMLSSILYLGEALGLTLEWRKK